MGIFDPDWVRLHRSMCNQYEDLALEHVKKHPSSGPVDVMAIVAALVRIQLPDMTDTAAYELVQEQHSDFMSFNVADEFRTALRSRNPQATDDTLTSMYEKVRQRFHAEPELEP